MRDWSDETLQILISELLEPKFADAQMKPDQVSLDDDLYETGIVDSYDIVELLTVISEKTGIDADITSADNGIDFTFSINSLSKLFLQNEITREFIVDQYPKKSNK